MLRFKEKTVLPARSFRRLWLVPCLLCALSGCGTPQSNAEKLAGPAGLRREQVAAGPFTLTAYGRIRDKTKPVTVYIEGDGLAWLSRWEPSQDPSPYKALGLSLAAADPSENVVYLARPCQFTPPELNPRCRVAYWTDLRFSKEVVDSMSEAITKLAGKREGRWIHLVGYSGGGAIAVLIAAQREDVASIRTVAGNLDHVELNQFHDVSPMLGSLNAMDEAQKVASIPQIHFSGDEDETVPAFIAEHFRQAASGACAQTRLVKGASHETGWRERWPALLREAPRCQPTKTDLSGG